MCVTDRRARAQMSAGQPSRCAGRYDVPRMRSRQVCAQTQQYIRQQLIDRHGHYHACVGQVCVCTTQTQQ